MHSLPTFFVCTPPMSALRRAQSINLFMAFSQGTILRHRYPSLAFGEAGLSCLWPSAKIGQTVVNNHNSPKAINRVARCWQSLHRVYRSTTIPSLKAMNRLPPQSITLEFSPPGC